MVDTRFAVSVHIVTALACKTCERLTSPELAESLRTNPVVVRRLVARLVEKGIVLSQRGKSGGLALAKPPNEISLKEVYQAVTDKPLVATSGKPSKKDCEVSCAMKEILCGVVRGMESASLGYLDRIKLSDLAKQVHSAASATGK